MDDTAIGSDWRGLPVGYLPLVEPICSADPAAAERNAERLRDCPFDVGLVSHGSSVFSDVRAGLDATSTFPTGEWDV